MEPGWIPKPRDVFWALWGSLWGPRGVPVGLGAALWGWSSIPAVGAAGIRELWGILGMVAIFPMSQRVMTLEVSEHPGADPG